MIKPTLQGVGFPFIFKKKAIIVPNATTAAINKIIFEDNNKRTPSNRQIMASPNTRNDI